MVSVTVCPQISEDSFQVVLTNVSLYDKEVFKAIRSLQEEIGADARLTFNQIAQRASVGRNTAIRSVNRLERAGWLVREKGRGHLPNIYLCRDRIDAFALSDLAAGSFGQDRDARI